MKYKMPVKSDLRSRTSTISNAFTISITPYIKPSQKEIEELLVKLDIEDGQCAYCLRTANSTDHFRPLVKDGLPNGYITDIHNLVPCCFDCNSSKGKKDWDDWYLSDKNKTRLLQLGLTEETIQHRYDILEEFALETERERIDYQSILGQEQWEEFIRRKKRLNHLLNEEQRFCDELRIKIEKHINK
ncbi:MAG: HNH endonuclease signature motif containing protein [Anaerovoracaceae bacterium]